MPFGLSQHEYNTLRDQYKGQSVSSKFRKLIGRYDPSRGTLDALNLAVANYTRMPHSDDYLFDVYQAIDAVGRSPKVEKYGPFLAELLLRLPDRPLTRGSRSAWVSQNTGSENVGAFVLESTDGATTTTPADRELLSLFVESQQDAAYRVFVQGSYSNAGGLRVPSVTWKKGFIASQVSMLRAWTDTASTIVEEMARQNTTDGRVAGMAQLVRNPRALKECGRSAIAGQKVRPPTPVRLPPPTPSSDRASAMSRRMGGAAVDMVGAVPDAYELGRAGPSGIGDARGFDIGDLGSGDFESRIGMLADNPENLFEPEQVDYFMTAIGLAMSCLGLASGAISAVRAGMNFYSAHSLKTTYEVVPFGSATASVEAIRKLLKRLGTEQAVMGGIDLATGVTGVLSLGGGPIVGLVGMGLKMLMRINLALRDAEEAIKARDLLDQGEKWKNKAFVMEAISQVPLLGAYFVMATSTSDLVGLLTEPGSFSIATFKDEVELVRPRIQDLRNQANKCQMAATWGLEPMTGWMQCLDQRWYMQPAKEAYNMLQEFRQANIGGMFSRGRRLAGQANDVANQIQ